MSDSDDESSDEFFECVQQEMVMACYEQTSGPTDSQDECPGASPKPSECPDDHPNLADCPGDNQHRHPSEGSYKSVDADAMPNGKSETARCHGGATCGDDDKRLGISKWGRRCRLPAVMFTRHDFSVWSILKQCIGRELSKITMPVIFNEPISFLQRITEYMEYATLLQKASDSDDPVKRLEYVSAFAISATAANWDRLGKPFNPLLGETYQLVREDLGFKMVCEQVSHHPPVSAFHTESPLYTFHGAILPKLKFWGKSIEITPKGTVTLRLHRHNEVYSWHNVNCNVHNIIVGKLWMEHYGAMEVTNHNTKHKAIIDFKPCGWFGKDLHKLEGFLYDENERPLRAFYGKWIEALYSCDASIWHDFQLNPGAFSSRTVKNDSPVTSCRLNLPTENLLWLADKKPDNAEEYYSFTLFTMMLNELGSEELPSTDSRLRPDVRKMEDGDIDGAADEKNRLEEKQRASRKERRKYRQDWKPRWFEWGTNPDTEKGDWLFTGKYWQRSWQDLPDIY